MNLSHDNATGQLWNSPGDVCNESIDGEKCFSWCPNSFVRFFSGTKAGTVEFLVKELSSQFRHARVIYIAIIYSHSLRYWKFLDPSILIPQTKISRKRLDRTRKKNSKKGRKRAFKFFSQLLLYPWMCKFTCRSNGVTKLQIFKRAVISYLQRSQFYK